MPFYLHISKKNCNFAVAKCIIIQKGDNMSAAQAMVSERFIDAIMEVSEEDFSRLIPLETAMDDLRLRATNSSLSTKS